ncbi:MAG: hypothetical protein BJ554DRAFT_3206 [Olpidium bornovanus]|uniref:CP-type G domain-containing protein n=1 Tax=Olpidium bornovanus TaxID=278681 RepID=A0A8H7ZPF4_9FUNG|nr:MAG: hypothetical protein BJ554DRAFT_3206 [Olpidium bornovanus]
MPKGHENAAQFFRRKRSKRVTVVIVVVITQPRPAPSAFMLVAPVTRAEWPGNWGDPHVAAVRAREGNTGPAVRLLRDRPGKRKSPAESPMPPASESPPHPSTPAVEQALTVSRALNVVVPLRFGKKLDDKEAAKRKAAGERQRQKAERQRAADARRHGLREAFADLESLARSAARREEEFAGAAGDVAEPGGDGRALPGAAAAAEDAVAAGRVDNSRKAYYHEFKKVVDAADVVLEVLDARDPLGCRALDAERAVLDSGLRKRVILVLNKVDLVPKDNVQAWLKYLRDEFPTVAFKASTQSQRRNLGHAGPSVGLASGDLLAGSECVGAGALVKLLKNYCRNANIKTSITVGVIGFPNVGKSSVINSLRRSKVCGVGSTPGLTKVAQEIILDKHIKLLDCPGIVFDRGGKDQSAEVLLRNCLKVELLEDPIAAVELIVERCTPAHLSRLYGTPAAPSAREFLTHIAVQRGHLKRGGAADLESAARAVLNDWNAGKIKYFTVPPVRPTSAPAGAGEEGLSVVQEWGKEFSLFRDDDVREEGEDAADAMDTAVDDAPYVFRPTGEVKPVWNGGRDLLVKLQVDGCADDDRDNGRLVTIPDGATAKKPLVTRFEEELNPRLNRARRKESKRRSKKRRAAAAAAPHAEAPPTTAADILRAFATVEEEGASPSPPPPPPGGEEDAFDFAEFMGGLPGEEPANR